MITTLLSPSPRRDGASIASVWRTFSMGVDRAWKLGGLAFGLMVAASAAAAGTGQPPNIVFILADDLGWADVAFHGGNAPTPHLDRLAREGVELTQHYVAPVCTPTRAGFMTGRYWSRFGVFTVVTTRSLPWETTTLPRALKSVGYETALMGKWHLGSKPEWGPNHYGFDHSYGSLGGGVGPFNHFYKKGAYSQTWHRNEKLITEEGHVTDLIANEAVEWIRARGAAPFFLYLPFTAVHLPVKEPPAWLDQVPAAITGETARHYAACLMHFDDAVGRVVAAIERAGKRNNTLIVFTSDNGGSRVENNDPAYPPDDYPRGPLGGTNSPLRGAKGSVYEGGIRVPAIANWPGRLAPGRFRDPMQIVDWMPTFCALARYRPEKDLKWDGVDVWPLMSGQVRTTAPRLLYTPFVRGTALRAGDWKLVLNAGSEKAELFDLASDPNETNDLALKMPDRVSSLRQRLAEVARLDRDAVVEK